MEAIGMEWGDRSKDVWQKNYMLAGEYYRQHKNLNIPSDYYIDGVNLGKWIYTQRARRKNPPSKTAALTQAQIDALDAIGMDWDKDGWEIRYRIAADYYRINGNIKIAQDYVSKEGVWIGKWLCEQRKRYRMPSQKKPFLRSKSKSSKSLAWTGGRHRKLRGKTHTKKQNNTFYRPGI